MKINWTSNLKLSNYFYSLTDENKLNIKSETNYFHSLTDENKLNIKSETV